VKILDTDTISFHQLGRGPEFEAVDARRNACVELVAVTIVSFEEQMRGWLAKCAGVRDLADYIVGTANLHRSLRYYQEQEILDFDFAAAAEYKILKSYKLRIGTMDLRIASIARSLNATLVTHNTADFKQVPGLRVEDWTVPPKKA
jgi:tRNA(fMet)-specific endonuclease VapC